MTNGINLSSTSSWLVAGAIAGLVPFILSVSSVTHTNIDGQVSGSYRDWIAVSGGASAAICGLVAAFVLVRSNKLPFAALSALVIVLGTFQIARGFGAFYSHEPIVAPRPEPRPVMQDPATCSDADACDNLAADLDIKNPAGALVAQTRSCELGHEHACKNAADKFNRQKDKVKGRVYYQKGCDLGDGESCNEVAVSYAKGDGVAEDLERARTLFVAGCEAGAALACKNIAVVYYKGMGVSADPAKAHHYAARACHGGHYDIANIDDIAYACTLAGHLLENGTGVSADPSAAFGYYEKACDRSVAKCFNLAVAFSDGVGVKRDDSRARELHGKACEAGNLDACNNLGDLLNRGRGGSRDRAGAQKLFEKACEGGHDLACKNMKTQ